MVGKSRLVMVLSYLESIEDPYQYGDDYGDLVEYLKMLLKGEEDYVPEEYGRIDEKDFFEKHLKNSDYWKYPKFGEGSVGHAAKNQKSKKGKDHYCSLNSKPSPFNSPFDPELIERLIKNSVEPKRNEQGVIVEEDYLTEENQAVWELNERRLDDRIDKLIEEASDLIEEEYVHAKWKKVYKNKEFPTDSSNIKN